MSRDFHPQPQDLMWRARNSGGAVAAPWRQKKKKNLNEKTWRQLQQHLTKMISLYCMHLRQVCLSTPLPTCLSVKYRYYFLGSLAGWLSGCMPGSLCAFFFWQICQSSLSYIRYQHWSRNKLLCCGLASSPPSIHSQVVQRSFLPRKQRKCQERNTHKHYLPSSMQEQEQENIMPTPEQTELPLPSPSQPPHFPNPLPLFCQDCEK